MEKGRLAEIEALYLSLYGIALCLWLGAWRREALAGLKPTWRAWTIPWVFLGLGLLTKGPLHLLFFYAVVIAILVCAGRWRGLWNPAHLVGFVLMLGIFAAWAAPYLQQTSAHGAGGVWLAQFQGRMEVNETFRLQNWLLNIPRGLINYLPWTILLPLAWRRAPTPETSTTPDASLDFAVLRGLRWGIGVGFLVVSLAPGGQPRYTLPLLVPASIMLALVLTPILRARISSLPPLPGWLPRVWSIVAEVVIITAMFGALAAGWWNVRAFAWRWAVALMVFVAGTWLRPRVRGWRLLADLPALGLASAVGMALLTADFAIGAIRPLRRAESVRPVGSQINRIVGHDAQVAVLRPGFLPFLFYVHNLRYIPTLDALSASTPYLLIRENEINTATAALQHQQINTRITLHAKDKRVRNERLNAWVLLRLDPSSEPGL